MRKLTLAALAAGTLTLGGCAASPLGGLLGGILGDNGYNNSSNLSQFERAAVEACGREAQRYGQVRIQDARQIERDVVEVRGYVESYNQRRNFRCAFRSDGRIVGFDI